MGCDGGTIPRRDELVRVKKKPEVKDKDAELAFQWRCCTITQQILQDPIVICGLGRLYNKEALIEALLNREGLPECSRHIKNLKDVKNLNLSPNPEYKENKDDKNCNDISTKTSPYICPVIGIEMSGKLRFVAIWSCGCVFSERALKEVPTATCHKCQKPFKENDVVIINGNEEDLEIMKDRMDLRQSRNKKKKDKINKIGTEDTASSIVNDTTNKPSTSTNITKNVVSKKVVPSKRLGAVQEPLADSHTKKAKADYSVAHDPAASDIYKSLFTSHKSEQEQTRAHWITYNPFYN